MKPVYCTYHLESEPQVTAVAFYPSVIIVQARMGSERLPGKVLKSLGDTTLLQLLLARLRHIHSVEAICVATTTKDEDDAIEAVCKEHSTHCYRGESEDVLARFYGAALGFDAEVVLRVTADCPFIDPRIVERALFCFRNHYDDLDYLTNTLHRTYPRGMDVEIMRMDALEEAFFHATTALEKEHVTPYIRKTQTFRLANFVQANDQSHMRLTVDTPDDLLLIESLYQRLHGKNDLFYLEDIVTILKQEPELLKINAHVEQKKCE